MLSVCCATCLLEDMQATLSPDVAAALEDHLQAQRAPPSGDVLGKPFPPLPIVPVVDGDLGGRPSTLLALPMPPDSGTSIHLYVLPRKALYLWVIHLCHACILGTQFDMVWWRHIAVLALTPACPMWFMLYKPLISKKTSDLQWWLLHGILATSTLVHHLDPAASAACPFCPGGVEEDLHQAFLRCPWLSPLFAALSTLLEVLDLAFSEAIYLFSLPYGAANVGGHLSGQLSYSARLRWPSSRVAGTGLLGPAQVMPCGSSSFWCGHTCHWSLSMQTVPTFQAHWSVQEVLCNIEGSHLVLEL
ncbi:centrin-3 isoform X1 [Alligator mississippiensis]|uniref:centrin-3 isoform X1 n=1 Tax=Alligator mississippiensis TaxID=8496 RepID=UPI002877A9DD|nr:centrin-3 isoform X1 [Alligator mississippiensis]